jgi:hypothetical protein
MLAKGMEKEETPMATPTPSLAVLPEAVRVRQALGGDIKPPLPKPWQLPQHGLAVFHGETPRLSHYFLPRLLLGGKCVLFLDGANCADPRLLERLARQRNVPFAQFNQQIQIARAFTCFQLTELIARVPQFLADFPARVLIVTAFPELYFDEDVRDWDARVAFAQALANLRRWASAGAAEKGHGFSPTENAPHPPSTHPLSLVGERGRGEGVISLLAGLKPRPSNPPEAVGAMAPLAVAVFSAALPHHELAPSAARRRFFSQLCAAASEVWKFTRGADHRLGLTCERAIAGATGQRPVGRGGPLRPSRVP